MFNITELCFHFSNNLALFSIHRLSPQVNLDSNCSFREGVAFPSIMWFGSFVWAIWICFTELFLAFRVHPCSWFMAQYNVVWDDMWWGCGLMSGGRFFLKAWFGLWVPSSLMISYFGIETQMYFLLPSWPSWSGYYSVWRKICSYAKNCCAPSAIFSVFENHWYWGEVVLWGVLIL